MTNNTRCGCRILLSCQINCSQYLCLHRSISSLSNNPLVLTTQLPGRQGDAVFRFRAPCALFSMPFRLVHSIRSRDGAVHSIWFARWHIEQPHFTNEFRRWSTAIIISVAAAVATTKYPASHILYPIWLPTNDAQKKGRINRSDNRVSRPSP